jgi:hypothetical protein
VDFSKLKELLTECLELSADIEDDIASASSTTNDAVRAAECAAAEADTARDYASDAESSVDAALGKHEDLKAALAGIEALLEEESVAVTDVPVLIRRYGGKVKEMKAKGISPDEIAERLSISPVIVNIILEQQEAA